MGSVLQCGVQEALAAGSRVMETSGRHPTLEEARMLALGALEEERRGALEEALEAVGGCRLKGEKAAVAGIGWNAGLGAAESAIRGLLEGDGDA